MKKLIASAAILCLLAGPAHATQKSRATLQSDIATNFADNTSGAITPALLRSELTDITDSPILFLSDLPASGSILYNNGGVLGGVTPGANCTLSSGVFNCTGGGGAGTVTSGLAGQNAYYAANGTTISGLSDVIFDGTNHKYYFGRQGSTSPGFSIDASTASATTGVQILTSIPGNGGGNSGPQIIATSPNADETLTVHAIGGGAAILKSDSNYASLNVSGNRLVQYANVLQLQPSANNSAASGHFYYSSPADVNLTAATEASGIVWDFSGGSATHAAGTITLNRDFKILARTQAFASASTITTAATLGIDGPPVAGTNATITNAYALHVLTGKSYFGGSTVENAPQEFVVGTAIASASTIAPVNGIQHVTGTATITNITPPAGMSSTVGGSVTLIADGAWQWTTGGTGQAKILNTGTAVANVAFTATNDGTGWLIK